MKEFLVGLSALLVLAAMSGVFFLMAPFLMLLAFFLRILIVLAFGVLCIWLLGKLILALFDKKDD